MVILSPASSYISSSSWLDDNKSTKWTAAENKAFENALAVYDKDTPDIWHKIAKMVPGKSILDVLRHYKELEDDLTSIEAGLIPIPCYNISPFTLECGSGNNAINQPYGFKRISSNRPTDQERKKGVPWTEQEHKLFLMGLKKYGKGDWRNISRNLVVTKTATQVASHAQKYFIRCFSSSNILVQCIRYQTELQSWDLMDQLYSSSPYRISCSNGVKLER